MVQDTQTYHHIFITYTLMAFCAPNFRCTDSKPDPKTWENWGPEYIFAMPGAHKQTYVATQNT